MPAFLGSVRRQGVWLAGGFVPLWHLFSRYPLLFVPLAGFFVLHWGVALSGFDAVHIIWSDAPWTCVFTGVGVGLLCGGVMTAAWWLDARRAAEAPPPRPPEKAEPRPDGARYVAGWVLLCLLAVAPAVFRADLFADATAADRAASDELAGRYRWIGLHKSRLCVPLGVAVTLLVGLGGYVRFPRRDPNGAPNSARDKWLWRLGWGPPIGVAGGYVVVSLVHWLVPEFYIPWLAAPVTGLLLLGLLVTAATGLHRFGQARRTGYAFYPALILVPLLLASVGGYVEPIHQVPGLEEYYGPEPRPRLDHYAEALHPGPGGPPDRKLAGDARALWAWDRRPINAPGAPVIVLSVSGGASTSAVFVARSLFRLEARFPGYLERVRVITGASGGMLGAAFVVAQFRPGSPYRQDVRAEGYKQFVAPGDPDKAQRFADAYQSYRDYLGRRGAAERPGAKLAPSHPLGSAATAVAAAIELAPHDPYWAGMEEMEEFCIRGPKHADQFPGLEADFLSPIFQKWVHKDLNPVARFFPGSTANDRGTALERAWNRHLLGRPKRTDGKSPPPGVVSWDPTAPALDVPFDELREEEAAGLIPSLVFTPMIVEDGRQLVISNLDLGYMVTWGTLTDPSDPNARPEVNERAAISAVEFYRLFPKAVGKFRLGTAVRLNATFPVFSPAPELPTNPPRRVVDAGYYDNYGLVVATRWLDANQDVLGVMNRPVWVVQLWAYGYSRQSGALVTDAEAKLLDTSPRAIPDRALRTSSLPVGALFAAWDTSMANRGEERLNKLIFRMNLDRRNYNLDQENTPAAKRVFPAAYRFRKDIGNEDVPMNWVLTSQSLVKLKRASDEFQGLAEAIQKRPDIGPTVVDTQPQYQALPPITKCSLNEQANLVGNLYKLPAPAPGAKK